jgi:hypothetical protein
LYPGSVTKISADEILNHQAGTISGVAAVYQRHECHAERKQALDRWGAHIEQFVRTFDRPKEEAKSSAL